MPTLQSSATPSTQPSSQPSAMPTTQPSSQPSATPTTQPSAMPTTTPSVNPTTFPSSMPTFPMPSTTPTATPSVDPTTTPSSNPTNIILPAYKFFGTNPIHKYPLGLCEGDCDNDSQCAGDLICFQRNQNDPIPGCAGVDHSRTDYCIKKVSLED